MSRLIDSAIIIISKPSQLLVWGTANATYFSTEGTGPSKRHPRRCAGAAQRRLGQNILRERAGCQCHQIIADAARRDSIHGTQSQGRAQVPIASASFVASAGTSQMRPSGNEIQRRHRTLRQRRTPPDR